MAENQLQSPGVLVNLVDESQYVGGVSTSTPLIVIATAQNKSYQGKTCTGTLESNVVRTISSPSQLLQNYGIPVFYTDKYGNQLHGSSQNEYGLLALFNYLSLGNTAFVIRADIDSSFPDITKMTANEWVTAATNHGTGTITKLEMGHGSSIPETFSMVYDGVYFQIVGSIMGTPVDANTGNKNNLITPNIPYSTSGTVKGSANFTIENGTLRYAIGDMFTLSTYYNVKNVISSPNGFISSINISDSAMADVITVSVTQASTATNPGKFLVRGQYAGYIGSGSIGSAFVNPQMSFMITELSVGKLKLGDTFTFDLVMDYKTTFTGYGNGKISNVSLLPYGVQPETWSVTAKASLDGEIDIKPIDAVKPDGKITAITFFDKMNDTKDPDHVTQTDTFTLTCASDVTNLSFTRSASKAKDNLKIEVEDTALNASYTLRAKTIIDSLITGNISKGVVINNTKVNVNPVVDTFKFNLSKTLKLANLPTNFPWNINTTANASQFFGALTTQASNGWDIENWFNMKYGPGTMTVSNILATDLGNIPLLFEVVNAIDIASSSASSSAETAKIDMIQSQNLATLKQMNLISPSASVVLQCNSEHNFVLASQSGFANNNVLSVKNTANLITLSVSINGSNPIEITTIKGTGTWTQADTFSLIFRPQIFVTDTAATTPTHNYINIGGAKTVVKSGPNNLFEVTVKYPSISQLINGYSVNTYFGYCNFAITDVDNSVKHVVVSNNSDRQGSNVFVLNSGLQFVWSYTPTSANPYPNVTTATHFGTSLVFVANGSSIGSLNNLELAPVLDASGKLIHFENTNYTNNYISGDFVVDPVLLSPMILSVGDNFAITESVTGFSVSRDGVIVGDVTAEKPYVDNEIVPTVKISINGALVANNPYLATDVYSFNIAPSSFSVHSLAIGDLTKKFGKAKIGVKYNYDSVKQQYGDAPLSFIVSQGENVPWVNGDIIEFKSIVNSFSVIGSVSGDHGPADETGDGKWEYNNDIISFEIIQTSTDIPWVAGDNFTSTITSSSVPKYPDTETDAQKRELITAKLTEVIKTNVDIRSDNYLYSLAVAPGYHDGNVINALLDLAAACRYEFGICSHVPYNLPPEQAQIWANTNERKRDFILWYCYASGLGSNADGTTVFIDGTTTSLLQIALSDLNYPVWFAPMGAKRGKINTIATLGYVSGELGKPTTFIHTPINEQQRGLLYQNPTNVNPASEITGKGLLMMGQKTSQSETTALDRINVSRLVILMKRDIRFGLFDFISDPNDSFTRSSVASVLNEYMGLKLQNRAIYDYLVICDASNNTAQTIDTNRLISDIIIKPVKSAEFIYCSLHVRGSGSDLSM